MRSFSNREQMECALQIADTKSAFYRIANIVSGAAQRKTTTVDDRGSSLIATHWLGCSRMYVSGSMVLHLGGGVSYLTSFTLEFPNALLIISMNCLSLFAPFSCAIACAFLVNASA